MQRILLVALAAFLVTGINAQSTAQLESRRVHLPNGWALTPAGKSLPLGDPAIEHSCFAVKKYLAVTNNGQSVQSLQLIDVHAEKVLDYPCAQTNLISVRKMPYPIWTLPM